MALFRGRALPVTPNTWDGGVKTPSYQKIENEQIVETIRGQSDVPYLDGWHGTVGDGIPF